MNEEVLKPYNPLNEAKLLFNNPKHSDVCFLINGRKVYGHKLILSMGSPVFERMFYGDLKEERDEIEIKDLTAIGFMNALRYIYGIQLNFNLFDEIYGTYIAADKYLLHHFDDFFFNFIKRTLHSGNCCIHYERLRIIQKERELFRYINNLIMEASVEVFQCDNFSIINEETLIDFLSLDELMIPELELLEAVSKWVDHKVQESGLTVDSKNRRKMFEPIKNYILFSSLTADQIANCKEIETLLTPEETGLLVLHLLNKDRPLMIECKTLRKAGLYLSRVWISDDSLSLSNKPPSRKTLFRVSRRVEIFAIYSLYPSDAKPPCFAVLGPPNGVDLGLKSEIFLCEGFWCFSLKPPLKAEPSNKYRFDFTTDENSKLNVKMSNQKQLKYETYDETLVFDLNFENGQQYHTIKIIDFLPLC